MLWVMNFATDSCSLGDGVGMQRQGRETFLRVESRAVSGCVGGPGELLAKTRPEDPAVALRRYALQAMDYQCSEGTHISGAKNVEEVESADRIGEIFATRAIAD